MINTLAACIAKMEGFDRADSVANRCNNPGNLVYAKQTGARPYRIQGPDGKWRTYAKFATREAGWQALGRQLALYAKRGLTLRELFAGKPGAFPGYAPASDGNDPKSYLAFVGRRLGIALDTPLSEILAVKAVRA